MPLEGNVKVGSGAGLVALAGTIAFLGSMAQVKAWPSNGVRIITATIVLAILFSLVDNGPLSRPVKWLGILMVLVALITYVPKFSTKKRKR